MNKFRRWLIRRLAWNWGLIVAEKVIVRGEVECRGGAYIYGCHIEGPNGCITDGRNSYNKRKATEK